MVCSSPGLRASSWPPALAKNRVGSAALWETRLPQPILSLPGLRGFRNAPPPHAHRGAGACDPPRLLGQRAFAEVTLEMARGGGPPGLKPNPGPYMGTRGRAREDEVEAAATSPGAPDGRQGRSWLGPVLAGAGGE